MVALIALAVTLGICSLTGAVVDRALLGGTRFGPVEQGGRALMFGLGLLGALSMLADAAGLGVSAPTVFTPAGLLVAALLPRAWRQRGERSAPAPATTPGNRLVLAALALVALVSLALAVRSGWLRPAYQFDALTRWMFKAKVLAFDGTLRGAISSDPAFAFTHQRYPPLVSHLANLPRLLSGGFDDRIASALFPWFAVALTGVLYGALARRAGALAGVAVAAWFASLPLVAFVSSPPPGSGAFSAMADIPLALFATGAVLAAADAVEGRRRGAAGEAALLLGCAALTKNEGLPLVCVVGLMVIVFARERRWRLGLGVTLPALALYLAAWGLLARSFPALDEHYPARLTWTALSEGLGRLPAVLSALGEELLSFRRWNLTWAAALVLLALGGRALRARGPGLILAVVAAQLLVYALAYVITGWSSPAALAATRGGDPVTYLLGLTLGRLLLHIAPLTLCAALMVAPLQARR